MSARTSQRIADLEAVVQQQIKVDRGSVNHLAHQRRVAHVVAALDGVFDVLLGGVRLETQLLLELGGALGGVSGILAAVDGAVAAGGGELLNQHDAAASLLRRVSRRKARETAADDDDIIALVPLLRHFDGAHGREVIRRGRFFRLNRLLEIFNVRAGFGQGRFDGLEDAFGSTGRAADRINRQGLRFQNRGGHLFQRRPAGSGFVVSRNLDVLDLVFGHGDVNRQAIIHAAGDLGVGAGLHAFGHRGREAGGSQQADACKRGDPFLVHSSFFSFPTFRTFGISLTSLYTILYV